MSAIHPVALERRRASTRLPGPLWISVPTIALVVALRGTPGEVFSVDDRSAADPPGDATQAVAVPPEGSGDWSQWLGSPQRNNIAAGNGVPTEWDVKSGKNIRWIANLGSQTFGSPVVADGKVFVGTNNGAGYLKRYPRTIDLGCLLCFDERSGRFLWQHSSETLPRPFDLGYGVCSSPLVQGNRLWFVTNRCEVVCLDTNGFLDGRNDGPFQDEAGEGPDDADVIWTVDLREKLGVRPRHKCCCSVTVADDLLFVLTSNGCAVKFDAADAPSFLAVNKNTGAVLWADKSPGSNIMTGQWSSPAYGVLGGVEQVLFGGGDGWLYSFDPRGDNGKSKLLWKFDCNPKESIFRLRRPTRHPIVSTPVIADGFVYVAVGQDPEFMHLAGRSWCIDPTKRGDVSPTLVRNKSSPQTPVPYRGVQACDPNAGEFEIVNEHSAAVWQYEGAKPGTISETLPLYITAGSPAIKNGLLFIADLTGYVHCLDARSGKVEWTSDLRERSWSTPLIVGDLVYVCDVSGKVTIFKATTAGERSDEFDIGEPIYTTPVVANNVLYIAAFHRLFAIAGPAVK